MFLKNMGLAKILLLNILLVVFVVIIILGAFWIYDEYATFHKEVEGMRLEYIESQKTMIEEEVSQIIDYVEYIRFHHKGTEEQIQSEVLGWINELRYGENGYIFVNTFEGITLAHYKKENIGKNRIDLTDSNGVRINEELINVSKNPDGGYVDYVGTIKPDTNEPAPKIGYAQSIDDWQWSIGTGVYVDDIEVIIAEKRVTLQKEVRTQVLRIAVVLSAVIVLAILFAIFFSRKIKRESTVITSFFKEAVAGNKQVDTSELSIQEFRIIGDHANSMLLAKDEIERARRQAEEERKKMQERLIITDRLASVGELASGIAHELNNPLTGVISYSELLLEQDVSDDVRKDLEVINREAKRTAEVVKGLLSFARKQTTEKQPADINKEIQAVLKLRTYEQKVNNIEVDTHFAANLPEIIANTSQLQQVFLNIVINAEQSMLKAHKKGILTVTTEQVGDIIRVSFADDGPGITQENLGRLFDPFFTTKEVGKGTGLGLSICHGIITEHGGRIYAENKLGKGASFNIELPVGREE